MDYIAFSEYFHLTGKIPDSLQDPAIADSSEIHSDLFDSASFTFGAEDETEIEFQTPVGYFPEQYCF